jgi:flagellar basal-body rod modification protein FlgD
MAISPVSSATQTTSGTGGGIAGLSTVDFLNLLITQLKNQDPLNPTSSDAFLTETSQLANVQGINQLNQNLTQMLSFQQLTQGADLIGKKVAYLTAGSKTTQTGVVSAVSVANGQAQLTVGSATVPLSQVQSVTAA